MSRLFTLVHLALVFLLAWLGVSALYEYGAGKLEQAETLDLAQAGPEATGTRDALPMTHYSPVIQRDLFKTGRTQAPPEKPVPEPEPQDASSGVQPTKLSLELKGTITGTGSEPKAVIAKKGEPRQMLYAEGDMIDRARVLTVLQGKVILLVDGNREELVMAQRKSGADPARPLPPAAEAPAQVTAELVDGFVEQVTLTWDDVMALKDKMEDLRKVVRVRPHFDKGRMAGFRITNIRPDSVLYTRLGLRNGDVISGINDETLQSFQDMTRLYGGFEMTGQKLESNVSIKRSGRTGTIQYSIQ
jgi:general secretion pathway protein C